MCVRMRLGGPDEQGHHSRADAPIRGAYIREVATGVAELAVPLILGTNGCDAH